MWETEKKVHESNFHFSIVHVSAKFDNDYENSKNVIFLR